MFKSIFTRYIAAFMTIIIVSFAVLAVIVGSMITAYSVDEKMATTAESAYTVKEFFENELYNSDTNDLQHFIYYNYATLRRTLTLFTSYEKDLVLFLTDLDGKVLCVYPLISNQKINMQN